MLLCVSVCAQGEYLSWHSSFWCLSKLERGNCFRQKVHSVGSSLTAFSTARFLQHRFLLISHLRKHKSYLCCCMYDICGSIHRYYKAMLKPLRTGLSEFLCAPQEGSVYLQLGHVACSSLRRESARRWMKQPAHIKCPLVHCGGKKKKKVEAPVKQSEGGK